MNVLIVGTGVIGTIYGWALREAGVRVSHLVRNSKPEIEKNGAMMDVLDERKGFKRYNKTRYDISILHSIDETNDFDLVIVPTNWYQTRSALMEIVPKCKNAFFYILTSNWTGTGVYDELLPKNRYILGYPDGGGTVKNGVYWTNIGSEIHIAKPNGENNDGFETVRNLFAQAKISLDVQENMLHWLWVHNAGATAISLAFLKYRNTKKFLGDRKLLKQSFLATKECLQLCEQRGAYSDRYPEISVFKWPMWLLIPLFKLNWMFNPSMKRYTAHGEMMPLDDITRNYYDILRTAKLYNVEMPYFDSLEKVLY